MVCYGKEECKKYCSIVGAHFAMAPLSFLWVYGNLSAYLESYFRFGCSSDCVDGDGVWILSLYVALGCPGILLSKLLADKVGLKWTGIFGASILNICLFGSAWTVEISVAWTTVLLGAVLGLAQGLTLTVNFQLVSAWTPEKAALYISTTSGFSTALSIVENQLITAIVNPGNRKPNVLEDSRAFFSQQEILSRVPTALTAYAAITLGFQVVGYLLISEPPKPDLQSSVMKESDTKSRIWSNKQTDITISKLGPIIETRKKNREVENYGSKNDCRCTLDASDFEKYNSSFGGVSNLSSNGITNITPGGATGTEDKGRSLKPSEVVRTPVFYVILMFGIATPYSLVLKANYYKQFGLLYIHNDRYLTLVGTLIPIFATVSRITFGALLNKRILSIKDAFISTLSVNSVLCSFWFFAPQVSEILYMALTLGLAIVQSLYYSLAPSACLHVFGPTHFSMNYALVISSLVIVGILAPVVTPPLMHSLGWDWLFASSAILSAVVLVFVVITDFKIV